MLDLVIKDFKMMFSKERSPLTAFLGTVLKIIFFLGFIALETFLFVAILKKIKVYDGASLAFINLFLFIISIIMVLLGVLRARKLFFNPKDIEQLSIHPISNTKIVISKLISLFVMHLGTSLLIVYPIFISYGIILDTSSWFYFVVLFYPVLTFFFEIGIALIIVYPFWLIIEFLKKHTILQFILSILILFFATYIYSQILNVFVSLVSNNELSSLFSEESIAYFIRLRDYEIPIKYLCNVFLEGKFGNLLWHILISTGVFILGIFISTSSYHRVRNISINFVVKSRKKRIKVQNVTRSLIKKEIILLTRNSDYVFTFSGLLIVQPMLAYLVISSLNTIFTSGTFLYFISLVPNFVPILDVLLIMLFTMIINQGASQYISMEKRTIKVMKTIPVPFSKQLFIKMLIPFVMSFSSLFLTVLILWLTNVISFMSFAYSLILVSLLLIIYTLITMIEELKVKQFKQKSTTLSSFVSLAIPMLFLVVALLTAFLKFPLFIIYLMFIAIFVSIILFNVFYIKRKLNTLFLDLEAIN